MDSKSIDLTFVQEERKVKFYRFACLSVISLLTSSYFSILLHTSSYFLCKPLERCPSLRVSRIRLEKHFRINIFEQKVAQISLEGFDRRLLSSLCFCFNSLKLSRVWIKVGVRMRMRIHIGIRIRIRIRILHSTCAKVSVCYVTNGAETGWRELGRANDRISCPNGTRSHSRVDRLKARAARTGILQVISFTLQKI